MAFAVNLFPAITFEHRDPPESITVRPTPDGHLKCDNCRSYWCIHIMKVVSENWDATSLWEQLDYDQTLFEIPVRPTENIELPVKLIWKGTDRDYVRVLSELKPNRPSSLDNPFIGFLNRGEGRIHIRQMIIDWIEPELDVSLHRCTGSRHNYARQVRLQNRAQDRTHLFTNCWNLLFHGLCDPCYDERRTPFDSDLIPVT